MASTRRLAAILAADVAGYSRLMGADEEGMLERVGALRRGLVHPKIVDHHSGIVKTSGDGLLPEFANVVGAVGCAVVVQQAVPEHNAGVAADTCIELRIGDVIIGATTSMATTSTSRRGSRLWPMPAGCSSPMRGNAGTSDFPEALPHFASCLCPFGAARLRASGHLAAP